MAVELPRRLFSVSEYHRMIDAGVLGPEDRIELLEGEIVEMSPIGSRHASCVKKLNALLNSALSGRAVVGVQDPVAISESTELQPDLSLLRLRDDFYASAHPRPADILLIIEVADTSSDYDRRVKMPLYAKAGLPEVWLIDLGQNVVQVYRQPSQSQFTSAEVRRREDSLPLPGLEGIRLRVADMFP